MKLLRILPLLLAGVVSSILLGAEENFLDMGAIQGHSNTKGYEKQITILGFSYGGSTLQKVTGFNSIVFSKAFDTASPKVLEAAVKGTRLPEVIFTMTRVDGTDTRVAFARVVMKDVVVTGIQIRGDEGGGATEDMTLQYDRADWCEKPQNRDGTFGTEVCTSIVSNK